jgi:hypothetical protein
MRHILFAMFVTVLIIASVFAQQNTISMQDKYGHQLLIHINPQTGSAHRVFGMLPNINNYGFRPANLSQRSVERMSAKFFSDYSDILKVNPTQMRLSKAETDGKMWFITYKQAVSGILVYGTEVGFTINRDGDIVALGADAYQNVNISTVPKMTSDEAVKWARKSFGIDSAEIKNTAELIIYPLERDSTTTFRLTWKVSLESFKPLKYITYFVDAENGKIVAQQNNIKDNVSGNISGSYWPIHASDNPVHTGLLTTQIYLHNANYTYTSYTNSDNNGNYTVSIPYSGSWYIDYPLQSSYVKVYNYNGGIPQAAKKTLTTSGSGTLNLDWGASDSTSVRWLTTVVHDNYKNRFNLSAMDYQMTGYVNALDAQGNTANGWADGSAIAFGHQDNQPWARSSDVVYHEYTHNVIYQLYGSFIGNTYASQGSAMDEGLADYFACTFNNDAILGEDVGVNRNLNNSNIFPNNYNYDDGDPSAPYTNSLIISGACWKLRQSIGSTITDFLVFNALQISPHAHTFGDFESNVKIAGDQWYSGNYLNQIRDAFSYHGITNSSLNVSVSGPDVLSIGESGTWTVNASGGNGSYTYSWYLKSADPQTQGNWIGPLSSTSTYSTKMYSYDHYLYVRADVFSNNFYFGSNYIYVTCADCAPCQGCPQVVHKFSDSSRITIANLNLPKDYTLEQNYPNPFNPTTVINYQLPVVSHVTLKVFDVLGREVATLVDEMKEVGFYSATFDGEKLASGIYFTRMIVQPQEGLPIVQVRKMLLTK